MAKKVKIQCCFQRFEKKYVLTPAQYAALKEAAEDYLRPDEYGRYTIGNVYYDTPDYALIRASLEKPDYKEKLRVRGYRVPDDGGAVFVELKKKFDGVVYKRRTVMEAAQAAAYLSGEARPRREDQICHEIDWFLRTWRPEPKVFIAYEREALAGREDPEFRVTFDTGIRWRDADLDLRAGFAGTPLLPEGRILMEVKIPGAAPVWLGHLLSELEIYPVSFSKYGTCYARYLLEPSSAWAGKGARTCA